LNCVDVFVHKRTFAGVDKMTQVVPSLHFTPSPLRTLHLRCMRVASQLRNRPLCARHPASSDTAQQLPR
jgi:hypothetical protein